MNTHNVQQGTHEWFQLRATAFTASEAPAMMGCSPYMTRTELLHQKHTGLVQEVDANMQRRFDDGHATEAKFRPVAEEMIGDDLYPVTGSLEVEGLKLLASFDGLTMDHSMGFEHKLMSEANTRAIAETGEPPIYHCWQMEQQMLVSGAKAILFATSDGTKENAVTFIYKSKPERRAALIAGWKQFAADLATFVPSVVEAAKPTGKAPDTLPALRVEVTGMVTASNLAEFRETALTASRGVNRELSTDQDFANAEASVKWCEEVESRLKAAKEHALSQTATIDELFKTMDDISAEARRVRLDLEKLVKARKDAIRTEIVVESQAALAGHIAKLNERLGKPYMPPVTADFAGVIKGKRTVQSLRDAVSTELARAKIAANEVADRIDANLKHLREKASNHAFLFADAATIVLKASDDLQVLVANRINEHERAEEARREQERERIRAEEAARLEREAQDKRRAEEAEAQRQAQAAIAAAATPAPAPTTAPAPAPMAARTFVTAETLRQHGEDEEAADEKPTLKLGELNARLGFIVTADFLAGLGYEATVDRNARLYRESQFPAICAAIAQHVMKAAKETAAA